MFPPLNFPGPTCRTASHVHFAERHVEVTELRLLKVGPINCYVEIEEDMAGLLPPGPEVSWRRGRPLNRVVSGEDLRSGASPVEPLRGDSHSRGLRINTSARAGILPDI